MTVAFGAVVALVVLVPAFAAAETILVCGIASAIAAIGMIGASLALPQREVRQFSQTVKPIVVASLFIPFIWMLLQVLPLGGYPAANAIWASASDALKYPLAGTVTIDTGETVLALARYVAAIAIILLSAAVAMDRYRADVLLVLLTLVSTAMAAGFIATQLHWEALSPLDRLASNTDVAAIVLIGAILSSATLVRSYEKISSRNQISPRRPIAVLAMAMSVASVMVCTTAILMAPYAIQFAAVVGATTVLSVFAIRRWRLGLWGRSGLAATAALIVIALIATAPDKDADITLGLVGQRSESIERMLMDARWSGSGAGTFDALSPIYRDLDQVDIRKDLTAAATVAIEMGRPFLWFCCIALIAGAAALFRRAMLRKQDCFYASAGAGGLLACLIASFGVYGTLGAASPVILSVVCGLAVTQSVGTTHHHGVRRFDQS